MTNLILTSLGRFVRRLKTEKMDFSLVPLKFSWWKFQSLKSDYPIGDAIMWFDLQPLALNGSMKNRYKHDEVELNGTKSSF